MKYPVGEREITALAGVDLRIPQGQFLCVRGPSGSGKSTLLHVLAALRKPTSGRVRVAGVDVRSLGVREAALYRRRFVGIVFQFFNLLPMLTVEENIVFPLALDGIRRRGYEDRIGELLEQLDLAHLRGHHPDQLSGGEMQRVAIARALMIQPELVLADEPTGNLDSAASHNIWRILRDLTHRRGVTTLMVTHEAEATAYADRVVVLEDGRIIEDTSALS